MRDLIQHAWLWVRRILCELYPGTCTTGAGYWLLAWMMRSCHTIEHVVHTFLEGRVPIDVSSLEQLQGELRDAQHDAAGWQLNMLDGLVLLRDRELRRQLLLRARGGYGGVKASVEHTMIKGRMGHEKWGKPILAMIECLHRRDD